MQVLSMIQGKWPFGFLLRTMWATEHINIEVWYRR